MLSYQFFFQDRLGPLPSPGAGGAASFNTAVSAAVQAAAQAASRDLSVVAAAASTTPPASAPVTTAFFQNTAYTTQQTPPTTPLSVTTAVSSGQEPLFTISDHFVNTSSGSFATVNGNANTLTSIQGRQKMNENLVVS